MTSTTALLTASAVLMGTIQAVPAAAAAEPEQDDPTQFSNTIGSGRRLDRCIAAVALHVGGPQMKAKAIEGLAGTEEQLGGIVRAPEWWNDSPLKTASKADEQAGFEYANMVRARHDALTTANDPYLNSAVSPDLGTRYAPEFGEDIAHFTSVTQRNLAYRLGEAGLSTPSAEALARAKVIAQENKGKDAFHDWASQWMLSDSQVGNSSRTSSDIAAYLKRGGFPTVSPVKGTPEYRVDIEDLKQSWAACDYANPYDPSRKLNEPVMNAMVEWEQEYAGQAAQRATIMRAEADASKAAREATDDLIEALGQAWLADQVLKWIKSWRDAIAKYPGRADEPDKAEFDKADADIARYRNNVAALVTSAKAYSATAATAAQTAATAQQAAWTIADTTQVPRGRGLMYAQQSVQVTRASAAAAKAATKATETALAAAKGTAATSSALLAKAQTESYAIEAEFRRVAAEEAAKQAKAAADSATANATAATQSANAAKAARTTAEQQRDKAKTAATTAASERAKAQAEQVTASASRTKAATERAKAKEAEERAATQQTTATSAGTAADTATADATAKRKVADEKAKAAQTAREKAVTALQGKQATAARASALEAAATAAASSAAAVETRTAATKARTAANQAAEAATAAQTAADQATASAVTARSAATTAEGAAERAKANADTAWSAFYASQGAASAAHVAAATALDASEEAAIRADNAATASENATALAKKAQQDSAAATTSATAALNSAAIVVGRAYAAGQAALAARDSAKEAITAADVAISVGTPYQEKDSSAAFAVLSGQASKTIAEQQAAAAKANATAAAAAATAAQQTASQATGDAKLAAEAAALAASDSARAVEAVNSAQTAAGQASAAQKGAKTASGAATGHATQAGKDALSARTTAGAVSDIAAEADREATAAERHAAEANEKAGRSAEEAAEAARKAAESEKDAKDAEGKATDAQGHSSAAEEAAKKIEQEQREKNEAAHQAALTQGITPIKGGASNWPALGDREKQILLDACGQTCVDDYRKGLTAVSVNVVDWATTKGGQILFERLDAAKVKECLPSRDVDACLWALVDIPSSSVIVGRIPALALAIQKVSDGMRTIFNDADNALRRLNELAAVISDVRGTPRLERCITGVALHAGGASTKAKAIEGLTGTNAQLHAVIGDLSWLQLMPLGQATAQDKKAAYEYVDAIAARKAILEDANRPYAMSSFSEQITLHAPEFGAEVMAFTHSTQPKLSTRLGWDGHTNPSVGAIAQAKAVTEQNRGKDGWHDFAADSMLRDASATNTMFWGGTTSADLATYLRHGGFPAKKVTQGTPAFRVEVENLKQAWATCNHGDPVDPRNALSDVVSQASAEWDSEYAGQNTQRGLIMRAEADAAAATKHATDHMIEAIGQAWLAEQILLWQKYWHDQLAADPNNILKPKQALFDRANTDLTKARGNVQALVTKAKAQSALATAASQRAVSAQQDAWTIADASEVPRGRGLMYAQQSVQVARASGAAATAAAKATETALNAANATVATSQTLLALAQTEAHAVNTEFRRIAAQEAAAQAKAAADSADAYAASAAENAKKAKKAKETALAEEKDAKQAAADAQASRAVAELERANAAAYRATAESERNKAKGHEADAAAQGRIASNARTSADAAGTTASDRRGDAERAEREAVAARDRAQEAELRRDSLNAKAAALEANADADEGTDAATASRTAATTARGAANTATTAATNARASANAATTAAVNAREAATKAKGSASRAREASDSAWASFMVAAGSAAAAHAAAAEAIDASVAAAADAKGAKEQSEKASAAAKVAQADAAAARSEALQTAAWAATTAGKALAAVQASLAARDSAKAVIKPANEAISLGGPYQEADSSAAFAVLTGQQSLTAAQQQAAVAAAAANQAEGFSAEAKALAAQAAADMQAAAQASAAAATDAARAAKAYQRAQASASQAAADSKAAQDSAKRSDGYVLSAGKDALRASSAAMDAEADAGAADAAATEAEKDAASARATATQAEKDAASARATATQAETDAKAAEKAAEGARDAATEAQDAADRSEKGGSAQQISQGVTTGIGDVWAVLDHIEYIGEPKNVVKDNCGAIIHVGNCTITADITYKSHVDVYMCGVSWETYATTTGRCPPADTIYLSPDVSKEQTERLSTTLTMVEFNSGIDPIDVLLGDFIGCAKLLMPGVSGGSWGDCAWAASWFVAGPIFRSAKAAVMAADAALKTGIRFMDAFMALRTIGLTEAAVAGIISRIVRKLDETCKAGDAATFRVAALSVAMAGPDDIVKECQRLIKDMAKDGDHVVLGINAGPNRPGSNHLATSIGGGTFNHKMFGTELPASMGMGGRALWTVGVEQAVLNPNVKLSVSLDGVQGAKNADEALSMLLARGETIPNSNWGLIQASGNGTAWEMTKLRTAVRRGERDWNSIAWYIFNPAKGPKGGYDRVFPTRFAYPDGSLVPEHF
ncbi:polymorphic toxin type 27 domain-containing protein [Streptomyces sp. 5.8]|uniref:polymorphic toxin type 27 domain-containing protein n=1 Tax=Streptomyces sp. 5.8 TaxID=3406571 RepID=UPI003BB4CBB1